MDDQKQLPAPSEGEPPVRLDVALRKTLQREKFDPKILESVAALGKIGITVAPNSPPGFVMLLWIEIMHGRRAMMKEWERTVKGLRNEKIRIERRLKKLRAKLTPTEEEGKEVETLASRLPFAERDLKEAQLFVLQVGTKIGETGKDVVQLHSKIMSAGIPVGEGAPSWDPDATPRDKATKIEVHVHGAARVELREGES